MEREGKEDQPERRLKPFDQTQAGEHAEKSSSAEVEPNRQHDVGSSGDANETTNKEAALMPPYGADTVESTTPETKQTPKKQDVRKSDSGTKSPFLQALVGRGIAIVAAQELFEATQQLQTENQELVQKVELQRKYSREGQARRRQEDPEYKEKHRQYMREWRARKKREAADS